MDSARGAPGLSTMRHLIWAVPFGVAVGPTATWLFGRATANVWQLGPGALVPVIAAYLIYTYLRNDGERGPESSALGFAFLGPGLLAIALDAAIETGLLGAAGLVLCLPGLALLLLGARRAWGLRFPLALCVLAIPVPAVAVAPIYVALRTASATGAAAILGALGIPTARSGTSLIIPTGTYEVADVCSGFQTLFATVALALVLAYLSDSPRRRLAILACAPPLALLTNIVRVSALVLLGHHYGLEILDTFVHELSGLISFAASLVVLFAIAGPRSVASEAA